MFPVSLLLVQVELPPQVSKDQMPVPAHLTDLFPGLSAADRLAAARFQNLHLVSANFTKEDFSLFSGHCFPPFDFSGSLLAVEL